VAAPIAYEAPTIQRSWRDFVEHIPAMLLIWVSSILLALVGFGVYVLIALAGTALRGNVPDPESVSTFSTVLAQIGQLPFSILSNLAWVLLVAVPALHYDSGSIISAEAAFKALLERPLRYLLAGVFFSLVAGIGFVLCILPGIAVALVMPVYVNRIFLTDRPILEIFSASFQAVYRSKNSFSFVIVELVAILLVFVVSLCTCGLGALIAVPTCNFYLQNAAYHYGVIS
jgi:hypothetical protein